MTFESIPDNVKNLDGVEVKEDESMQVDLAQCLKLVAQMMMLHPDQFVVTETGKLCERQISATENVKLTVSDSTKYEERDRVRTTQQDDMLRFELTVDRPDIAQEIVGLNPGVYPTPPKTATVTFWTIDGSGKNLAAYQTYQVEPLNASYEEYDKEQKIKELVIQLTRLKEHLDSE